MQPKWNAPSDIRQALAILLGENLSALPPHAMRALAARPRQFDLQL